MTRILLVILLSVLWSSAGQGRAEPEGKSKSCLCMEYWSCAARNGQPYSYCGLSDTEVCCFIDFDRDTQARAKDDSNYNENNNNATKGKVSRNSTKRPSSSATTTATTRGQAKPTRKFSLSFPERTEKSPDNKDEEPVECGVAKIEGNLDSIARFKEWPWHVAILETVDDLYICGGSLISKNRILTAAHCIESYTKGSPRLKIRLGEYDVSTNDEPSPHVEVIVNMVAIHPEFNNATLENDIAILGTSRDIIFQDNVQPICLPQDQDSPKPVALSKIRRCVVTGWGRRTENTPHSIVLKEIILPIWNSQDCEHRLRTHFGPDFKLPPSAICAGDEKRDSCDGDGGGPLVCFSNGKWVQEGIVSFGIGCGKKELPGVYTKVSWFASFIDAFLHSGISNEKSDSIPIANSTLNSTSTNIIPSST